MEPETIRALFAALRDEKGDYVLLKEKSGLQEGENARQEIPQPR